MTMDISSRKADVQLTEEQLTTKKRPFDVAFLMLPDDKLKQKQKEAEVRNNNRGPSEEEDLRLKDGKKRYLHKQIFDNPKCREEVYKKEGIFSLKPKENLIGKTSLQSDQKSAFTKVNLLSKEPQTSPSLSASPDTYQNSLSPSPPIINRAYHANMLSPGQIFKQTLPAYQNSFIQENLHNFAPNSMNLENPFLGKHPQELFPPTFAKMRPMLTQYRNELPYNYSQFPPPDMLKIAQPDLKFPPEIRNPAAAILSTLLPPSLAALSLPAQNVCAKCNISFRMTSDLVYHMRSQHKNEALEASKKRREEKLKCPVCAESFRERHHLTRHMTAHQDKDEDEEEPASKKKAFANFNK